MKNIIVVFTKSGVPELSLHPTLRIYNLAPGSVAPLEVEMVEVGYGIYRYDFTVYNPKTSYTYMVDGGDTLSGAERYKYGNIDMYENCSMTMIGMEIADKSV